MKLSGTLKFTEIADSRRTSCTFEYKIEGVAEFKTAPEPSMIHEVASSRARGR